MPPSATPTTVFVVDDDRPMRESLASLFEALELPVRTFASGAEFRAFYRPELPGCLVLDVRMPVQDGLQLYEQLLAEGKRLPVIFITAHADVSTAVAAMKSGAIEFLEKPFDRHTLIDRIRKALALDAEWRQGEARYSALEDRIRRLNERDRETLEMILDGEPNKVMAARLGISERAVEMRRASLMKKLDVESLAELLELTVTHRVLSELRTAALRAELR
jgi:FixJ family two-component response regulator